MGEGQRTGNGQARAHRPQPHCCDLPACCFACSDPLTCAQTSSGLEETPGRYLPCLPGGSKQVFYLCQPRGFHSPGGCLHPFVCSQGLLESWQNPIPLASPFVIGKPPERALVSLLGAHSGSLQSCYFSLETGISSLVSPGIRTSAF